MFPGTHARSAPDRAAVIMSGTGAALSYGELDRSSARLARYWHEQGLRRGDVVALVATNLAEVFIVYWAAQRSGLYITAINHNLTVADVSYILTDSGAKVIVTGGRDTVVQLAADAAADAAVPLRLSLHQGRAPDKFTALSTALDGVSDAPLDDQPRGSDLLYSSGTTGRPKGIKPPLPDRQVSEPGDPLVAAFGPLYGFGEDTVYLSPAPVYHAAPLRFCAVVQSLGGTVVLMERFDPREALAAIERYRVTHSQWVPTMFVRMLKLGEQVRDQYDLSSHRVAVHAAAPCPVEVKQAMIDWWGPIVHEYYGATEAHGLTVIDPRSWLQRPGSVGRAALGVIHICDSEGTELPAGEVGVVYFERDEMPFEYLNDPERTRAAQHPKHPNWSTTGDLGRVDEDGYLYLADRQEFVIISGGVNIYPQEIEDGLALHPAVDDIAVIGVPDPEMGEAVMAVVQPAAGTTPGDELAEELRGYLEQRIARFKLPRHFQFVDTLPRTPTGKLVKRQLRKEVAPPAGD